MHSARVIFALWILIVASAVPAISIPIEGSNIINLMIGVGSYPDPEQDQVDKTHQSLVNLMNEVDGRNLNATLFISEEAVKADRLYLTFLGNSPNHEMSVYSSLDGRSISEDELEDAKEAVESCHVCGGNTIGARGIFCQSPSADSSAYEILEDAGIAYHTGYQTGIIYAPGHEEDSWPYHLENGIYAVPISSYNISGERVPLSDRAAKDIGMSGDEWYSALEGSFEESAESGEPMVIFIDNLVSGKDESYLGAFVKFLDYATSRNATFVTTMDLVNLSAVRDPMGMTLEPASIEYEEDEDCEECDSVKEVIIAEVNETKSNDTLSMPVPVMTE